MASGMFSDRDLKMHDVAIYVNGNAAWSEFRWDFHAILRKDGSTVTTHGVETQDYRKEEGKWRLVHVHYFEDRQPTPSKMRGRRDTGRTRRCPHTTAAKARPRLGGAIVELAGMQFDTLECRLDWSVTSLAERCGGRISRDPPSIEPMKLNQTPAGTRAAATRAANRARIACPCNNTFRAIGS